MRIKHKLFILFLFLATLPAVFSSCNPEACFEETNAFLKATFYSNETKEKRLPTALA